MNQSEFTRIFCQKPESFAWFLGAGASHNANLPTADDILTDLKRRHYNSEENQTYKTKDLQNSAVREIVESFMQSQGFPERWAADEYTTYFQKIFGDNRKRQRNYIAGILSEDRVRLSIGNRVLGALMVSGMCRVAFTTNFDPVVEKAVASVGGKQISAYHLEGAHNAVTAINNEEYPFYCKLHGDFQYDSIKNLEADLASQNAELSRCLSIAGSRMGFVVAGYSGRDESVMTVIQEILNNPNPFPHGLYWMKMKNSEPLDMVTQLMEEASSMGIDAEFVDIETFDTVMLRIWRNLDDRPDDLDKVVRKGRAQAVSIPMPSSTGSKPLVRFNALPITKVPNVCGKVHLKKKMEWDALSEIQKNSETTGIYTLGAEFQCWGSEQEIKEALGSNFLSTEKMNFDSDWRANSALHLKRFLEDGLATAFCRERPLLMRKRRSGVHLIVDNKTQDVGIFERLFNEVGKTTGFIPGLHLPAMGDFPAVDRIGFAESIHLSLAFADDRLWMVLKPDVWIFPTFARRHARGFLDNRKSNRQNDKLDAIFSAWIGVLSDDAGRNATVSLSPFDGDTGYMNPVFEFSTQTGFAMKRGAG
ncbi:MAG: SIR2 family protein [Robiginitomaculum sp.]|nr:MAG: SIR2 family protein [Robiginitomaculum sp.]